MGNAAIIMSGINAAITDITTVLDSEAARKEQEYQADVYASNAQSLYSQANLARQQGEVEKDSIDSELTQLRRDYNAVQGQNTSLMAAGNVVLESGSALDTIVGNANLFAEDVGENRYNYALADWEAENNARQLEYQGDVYDAQSSWLDKTSGSLGLSLLSGHIAGYQSFTNSGAMSSIGSGAMSSMGG